MNPTLVINKKDGTVTIVLALAPKGTISKSGKSLLLASTGGNVVVGSIDGKDIRLGVNAYTAA